jgi:hypothetical protein
LDDVKKVLATYDCSVEEKEIIIDEKTGYQLIDKKHIQDFVLKDVVVKQ